MTVRHEHENLGEVASALAVAALALARRFAQGGTLWCWAPGAPEHAQHIAVEFVHPVVVGTRALPAVALLSEDIEPALRPLARAGDVLVVVADGDAAVNPTLRRAQAWGLTTLWLGAGRPPVESSADHLLWLSEDGTARLDGRLVLGYHLLWELTHVCFEHPGLLEAVVDAAEVCITCSDEGRLGEVVESHSEAADVRMPSGVETVSTLLVGPVQRGDLVLVHAGTAIAVVDP